MQNDEQAWTWAYNYVANYLKKAEKEIQDPEDIVQDTMRYFIEGGLQNINNPRAFKQLLPQYRFWIEYELCFGDAEKSGIDLPARYEAGIAFCSIWAYEYQGYLLTRVCLKIFPYQTW